MAIKPLLGALILLSLGGCMSQIFLDKVPTDDLSHVAVAGTPKQIHVVASTACDRETATHYQIREQVGQAWTSRCARIQGFDYRPGHDYILQVTEYAAADASLLRLVLDRVIAERPHQQEWTY